MMSKPAVGDWIRFMRGGHLVIDQVAYIVLRSSHESTPEALTLMYGQVRFDDIVQRSSGIVST